MVHNFFLTMKKVEVFISLVLVWIQVCMIQKLPKHLCFLLEKPFVLKGGGNLKEICKYGLDKDYKLIVNSSRSIIYASADDDFAEKAALEAKNIQNEMESYIDKL